MFSYVLLLFRKFLLPGGFFYLRNGETFLFCRYNGVNGADSVERARIADVRQRYGNGVN